MSADAAGAAEVRHPVFARAFDRLSGLMENEVGEHRHRSPPGSSCSSCPQVAAYLSGDLGAGVAQRLAHGLPV